MVMMMVLPSYSTLSQSVGHFDDDDDDDDDEEIMLVVGPRVTTVDLMDPLDEGTIRCCMEPARAGGAAYTDTQVARAEALVLYRLVWRGRSGPSPLEGFGPSQAHRHRPLEDDLLIIILLVFFY
jgi:hypothetical protein